MIVYELLLEIIQEKHEENHQPKMHRGLVIKDNANQRYATNAITSFIFREIAKLRNLPTQVRSDYWVCVSSDNLYDHLIHLLYDEQISHVCYLSCGFGRASGVFFVRIFALL